MSDTKYYVAVSYDLMVGEDGKQELMERATEAKPLTFYSGIGMMLEKFEQEIMALQAGDAFDFTIPAADAYGEYDDESVIDLDRSIFEVDGKIDDSVIFPNNVVPLMDSEGNRINATVVKITDDKVKVDLNHPLAGENLHFIGKVLVRREATQEEIENAFKPTCGGGCGGCKGGCGSKDECGCGGDGNDANCKCGGDCKCE